MVTQELGLRLSPTALLSRCSSEQFVFALDGGSTASWGSGLALLGFAPRATLRITADGEAWVRTGRDAQRWDGDPFDLLERFRAAYAPRGASGTPWCAGGVIATLSYDLRRWVEPHARFRRHRAALQLPVLHAAAYDWMLAYAYSTGQYHLGSWRCSSTELRQVAEQIESLATTTPAPARPHCAAVQSNLDAEAYAAAVRAALEYIAAGDIYQVNLAQRFTALTAGSPHTLYAALQCRHPAPFAAYVAAGDFTLVSNSPECFLAIRGDTVATFPIKGTRPRGNDASSDAALVTALRSDSKERAEHVMIVDLERNDLGRVCRLGTVHVEKLACVQTLPSLHHLVSKVTGELRADMVLANVLRATFPGGSITGAPKIRAMEIIDELEQSERNFYTGAIAFLGVGGDATFNLAIRTAVATAGRVTYHAGGGIVADSIPAREYDETLLKAQPFLAAMESAT